MSKPSKAMIWSLGHSLSYADLSLKGKLLWPVLLSECDEQGRFIAEPKDFKRSICPIIDEITFDDAKAIVSELHEHRMVLEYSIDGQSYGQVLKWWDFQNPMWARRSKYPPPQGWTDRIREKIGNEILKRNWDSESGGQSFGFRVEGIEENRIEQNSIVQNRDSMTIESSSYGHTMDGAVSLLSCLQSRLSKSSWNETFAALEVRDIGEKFILLSFPNQRNMEFARERMGGIIKEAARAAFGQDMTIRYEVRRGDERED